MGRVFYFSDKSPVVNPDEYLSLSGEQDRIICLSLRDIHLLNAYLWPYTEWRTRFSRPFNTRQRIESTLSEFIEFQSDVADLSQRLGEVSVASCSDGLMAIADALRLWATNSASARCCENSGSAGQGQHAPPYNPDIISSPGEGYPPEGFDSWEQWYTNKCAIATDIVTTMRGDVGRMGTLNLVGATVTSLAPVIVALLLDPVPGDEVVVIASMLIVALGLGYTILEEISDILTDYASEFICILFSSESSEVARSDFLERFAELWVVEGGNSVVAASASTLVGSLLNSAVTNRLFVLETGRELPPGDCSGCASCVVDVGTGNIISEEDGVWVIESVFVNSNPYDYQSVDVYIKTVEDAACPDGATITLQSITGYTNSVNPNDDDAYVQGIEGVLYTDDDPPTSIEFDGVIRFNIVGQHEGVFTVTFLIENL